MGLWVVQICMENRTANYLYIKMVMKYKITQSELKKLIRESVTEAIAEAESGGWVVDTNEAREAYNLAAQEWGEEEINRQIVRAMGERALSECLAFVFRMNDFQEWEEYKRSKETTDTENPQLD